MNRVLADLYGDGQAPWLTGGRSLVRCHGAYLEELRAWHSHLPVQLAFGDLFETKPGCPVQPPSNELSLFLQTRYAGVMEWIHRPLLYIVLNGKDKNPQLVSLAQKAVDSAAVLIRLVAAQNRHGGIWGLVRRSFGAALLLIGASCLGSKSDEPPDPGMVELPDDWEGLVRLSLATIRRWESSGTTDFRRMHDILHDAMRAVMAEV
ncbi:hypothetical protein ACJZ2D_013695 [Fusarium nematophilum]